MENIVKALNNYIRHNYGVTGTFVYNKCSVQDKNFKALTRHSLYLYYVNKGQTYPIIETTITSKEGVDDINKVINMKFLEEIFDYIDSNEFKDLMDGTINI